VSASIVSSSSVASSGDEPGRVDVVGIEAPQAVFDCPHRHLRELPLWFGSSPILLWNFVASTTRSRRSRIAFPRITSDSRAEYRPIGGIDEVDPRVERGMDDARALVMVAQRPRAEVHSSEAERAHRDARPPEDARASTVSVIADSYGFPASTATGALSK